MNLISLEGYLRENVYPGRGVLLGRSGDGQRAVVAYFIMGRSENSRNRVFVADGNGIKTQAFDQTKLSDPSLIIYSPVRVLDNKTIVTNGDQTDTIYDMMSRQFTFEQALSTREFEPDAPNYTPRISGIVKLGENNFNFALSILKSAEGNPDSCQRFAYSYYNPQPGVGRFIHTYKGDGNPLPSFAGEPVKVSLENKNIDEFASGLWDALNSENKVSLFVRYINIKTGVTESRIINKNK